MAEIFDQYRTSYNREVDDSISFSGLKHDFFLQAKVEPLAELIAERGVAGNDGTVRALDVGCGVGALHPYVKPLFSTLCGCDISTNRSHERARKTRGLPTPLIRLLRYLTPTVHSTSHSQCASPTMCLQSSGRTSFRKCGVSFGQAASFRSSSTTRLIR